MDYDLKVLFDKTRKESIVTDPYGIELARGSENNVIGTIGRAIVKLGRKTRKQIVNFIFVK